MDPRENLLRIYRELADLYERQRQPQMRDRFLVLAADAALLAGRNDESERLRLRLLKVNPHHMLKPYSTFAHALKAPDVLTYVKDLRMNYPADVAEDLLRTLQAEAIRPASDAAASGIPATAPVVDIGGSLPSSLAQPGAEPAATLEQTAAPGPLNAPRARPPVPQTIPLQPQRAAPRPAPARRPLPAPPPDARPGLSPPDDDPPAAGSWLASLLFLLVLLAGVALAGYTFLRPYLPLP
jgi:hypothetical protein